MRKNLSYQQWKRWSRMVVLLIVLTAIGVITILYCMTKRLDVVLVVISGYCFMGICMAIFRYLDDCYISKIVTDLSDMTDTLMELQENDIFPENEDTLVSKLQTKVIKLVRILTKKEAKAKQDQENMKSLVSDISHQLKTPISNLMMYSEFLKDDTLSKDKRNEYITILSTSVERLYFLSESMIKISRLESGLIHLDLGEHSLNETVLRAVKNVYTLAKNKNIEILYEEENEIRLIHDSNWTAEAVYNMLDNAVKYGRPGAKVWLRVQKVGMFARIQVEDENGPIPEEEQAKIFCRFGRGSNSRQKEGLGIGLYLAREIAILQNGYVDLHVTEKGNVFSFVIYNKIPSK